ncbi:MAG: hypothetical protein M1561_02475 [Gammaproteobacteria bacterium]|nr:hypothetical protein [Gammaproteobacteria bacterium]
MQYHITPYASAVNKLPLAARIVILLLLMLVIYLVWYYTIWANLQLASGQTNAAITTVNSDVDMLQKQLDQLKVTLKYNKEHPVIAPKHEISPEQIQLISPGDMRQLLGSILTNKHRLVLIKFQNLPMHVIEAPQSGSKIFEYRIVLQFQGDFFATYKYLREIENLKWRLFWDKFNYKVIKYPLAEVTLQIHTLSDQEVWLNA